MTLQPFEGCTFGKWILAGEHTVLRGGPALAFPLLSRGLQIQYFPSNEPLHVSFSGQHGNELQLLFWGVLEKALEMASQHVGKVGGEMRVRNDLPAGAGLGASAALCAGIGRWCERQGFVDGPAVYEFSRQLENLFHGESSGVDIAVSLSGKGIRFTRAHGFQAVVANWQPRLFLSYSGHRGVTSECVAQVKSLLQTQPELGGRLDEQMKQAVALAQAALMAGEAKGWEQLKAAFDLARNSFEGWGLVSGEFQRHLQDLEAAGAQGVKPTGSGGGGYALSLWHQEPPSAWRDRLIALEIPTL